MKDIGGWFVNVYCWMKSNDLPNWLVLIFTGILWPLVSFLVAFWWTRRTVTYIQGLRVSLALTSVKIGQNQHPAVDIAFVNNTDRVVYLNQVKIKSCSALFPVPTDTSGSRDISQNVIDLTFLDPPSGMYSNQQVTLHTGKEAKVSIAISEPLPETFYSSHRLSIFRRYLRWRKYFVLEYTAMVGNRKYSVATPY